MYLLRFFLLSSEDVKLPMCLFADGPLDGDAGGMQKLMGLGRWKGDGPKQQGLDFCFEA